MQPLSKCSRAYGYTRIKPGSPEIEIHRNVLYDGKGLYDWRRRLIPTAAYFQGVRLPNRELGEPLQDRTTALDPLRVRNEAPDPVYIWGGPLFNHYGHFLLDTLSRLSFLHRMPPVRPKVLFWSNEPAESRRLQSYQNLLFDLIGLSNDDIVILDRPTLIREVLVQAPAFECNSYVHEDYAAFCHRIGNEIMGWQTTRDTQPVYVGKHGLQSGVARLTNECEFVEHLDRAGVKIVSPETLTFDRQVALWMNHDVITGYLGSATHTALFARRKNVALLNHESQVYSNQIMIDMACEHRASYYSVARTAEQLGGGDGFHLNFRMSSPRAVADQWLRIIDRLNSDSTTQKTTFGSTSIDERAYLDEPFGTNLSVGRPADQSSIFPPHSIGETTEADALRAVDGRRHERYAFHTTLEEAPWWQVDLGSLCCLHEIRIFNRLDIGNENCRCFDILLSENGLDFTTAHSRDGEPFGLPDGRPYRWLCDDNPTARYVRIRLRGRRYLHLCQVEVFGEHLPRPDEFSLPISNHTPP